MKKKSSWLLVGLLLGLAFLLPPQGSAHAKPSPLRAEVADVLFVPGKPRYRKIFQRGPVTGFAERREAWDLNWTKTSPAGR